MRKGGTYRTDANVLLRFLSGEPSELALAAEELHVMRAEELQIANTLRVPPGSGRGT